MHAKSLLIGAFLGIVLLLVAGLSWLALGGMPMGTAGGPLPFEKKLAKIALSAAMRGETDRLSPLSFDENHLIRGAKIYQVNCAVCHGLPSHELSAIAQGMFPPPPKLMFPNKGVTDDEIGEIFWKVKNGIRLTGMPGFQKNLTENEMWEVSMVLLNAHKLPASVQAELAR